MPFLLLLPFIPAVWVIVTKSVEDALIYVYLPIMLLLPTHFDLRLPHLWAWKACDSALFPIVVVALVKYWRKWHWQRSDLWIALFLLGDALGEGRYASSRGLRGACVMFMSTICPYIVGKLLLEQEGMRQRFLRRFLWILAFIAVVDVIEWRLARNLFEISMMAIFTRIEPLFLQMRGGFTRTQGPFGHPIAAGTVFATAWIFALWLRYVDQQNLGAAERRLFGLRRSTILVWMLFAGLIMCGSRGPWIGAAVGLAIARVGRATNVRRTAVVMFLVCSVAGMAGFAYLNRYTAGDLSSAKDKDQENAIYRRVLVQAYEPVVQAGGMFGWGEGFPRVPGAPSVDNEYLWLRLSQGPFGLALFILLSAEASLALLRTARRSREKQDFYFAFIMLAVLVSVLTTGGTVSLMYQSYYLFFFYLGWSLSLRPTPSTAVSRELAVQGEYRFRRIFA
jgi:hypothetical protein